MTPEEWAARRADDEQVLAALTTYERIAGRFTAPHHDAMEILTVAVILELRRLGDIIADRKEPPRGMFPQRGGGGTG